MSIKESIQLTDEEYKLIRFMLGKNSLVTYDDLNDCNNYMRKNLNMFLFNTQENKDKFLLRVYLFHKTRTLEITYK